MQIERHFTVAGESPHRDLTFTSRTSRLVKLDGTIVFASDNVVVPDTWDQTSTDILAQKYFRRKGCNHLHDNSFYNSPYTRAWMSLEEAPPERGMVQGDFEFDLRQTIHRIVGALTHWGERLNYFSSPEDGQAFYDELSYMMSHQMFAPNSPQWFNTGLGYAYGLEGAPQGHFFVDEKGKVLKSKSAYERPQTSACFIQSCSDDLVGEGGIMDLWVREARLFKYGSGSGTNFSAIRGKNEPLSGGGVSSGLISFLRVGDRAAGSIKSGGTSRRAAKLVCLDLDHPDIEEFIDWKVQEERKVAMLVAGSRALRTAWEALLDASKADEGPDALKNLQFAQALKAARRSGVPDGFLLEAVARLQQGKTAMSIADLTTNWEGDAYDTISAQNANNSLRVPDAFMEAVLTDGEWKLTRRVDGVVSKIVKARDLWSRMGEAAWSCADPGVQFDTTFNFWHTCPADGAINATNPCSEYAFLDDTACNLGSLNLVTFLNGTTFDAPAYIHACELMTLALDITVSMSQYPSRTLAENSHAYRTLGGGYANLGGLLMRMGLPYDSPRGRIIAAGLTAIMTGVAYKTSALLASELGPFPAYERNKESILRVLSNHHTLARGRDTLIGQQHYKVQYRPLDNIVVNEFHPAAIARQVWDDACALAEQHGLRNAQVTVLAPTGTIGILMGCDTTGVEPDFALVKYKQLAGGGYMRLVNSGVPAALQSLGYTIPEIVEIVGYISGETICGGHTSGISQSMLLDHGYDLATLKAWDEALISAFDPRMVLPVVDLQEAFGETATEMFLQSVGGRGTIEGAPHLNPDHLPVFDCASRCGKHGTRFISPMGHLEMMAATQPFITGSISKTVNLPGDTTIEEVENLYMKAWTMGIKAVAFYRDGSKLSQPLATSLALLEAVESIEAPDLTPTAKINAVAEVLTRHAIRKKLPSRRGGYTQAVKIGGNKFYLRTGEYEDGSLGEIFLDSYKEGTGYKAILNAFAIAISIGLQHGVPLEEFCDAYLFTKFEPNGVVQDHESVKMCLSVLDFIFRDLAITYLQRYELANVSPEDLISESGPTNKPMSVVRQPYPTFQVEDTLISADDLQRHTAPTLDSKAASAHKALDKRQNDRIDAQLRGYTGDPCPTCGHLTMVRNGVCTKCQTCGSTTGCS